MSAINIELGIGASVRLPTAGKYCERDIAVTVGGFNIAYGETAPDDTSKLWVKTSKPSSVAVLQELGYADTVPNLETVFPAKRYGGGAAVFGNRIYIFGGYDTSNMNEVFRFDVETSELTQLPVTLPFSASYVAVATLSDSIYVIENSNSKTHRVSKFDPTTESLTTLPKIENHYPYASGYASVGNKLYLFGGGNATMTSVSSTIACYDADTETFATVTTGLPKSMQYMSCCAVGTKIYIVGGMPAESYNPYFDTVYCFDTETETITTLSTVLPIPMIYTSCGRIGDSVYIVGGAGKSEGKLDTILKYDTVKERLEIHKTKLSEGMNTVCVASVGDSIYLFGGSAASGKLDTICRFVDTPYVPENELHIATSFEDSPITLIDQRRLKLEIGVRCAFRGNGLGLGESVEAAVYKDGEWTTI